MCAKVLCYGEIDLDIFLAVSELPDINRTAYVLREFDNIGGAAANTAMWLANWGIPTRLVGHELGDDLNGDFIRKQLRRYPALETQHIVYHKDYRTPRCQCLVTPDGERTFVMHWLDDIRVSPLTEDMLVGIEWLNLDMSGPLGPRLSAAHLAKAHNVSVLVNDIYSTDHPLLGFTDIVVLSAPLSRSKNPDIVPMELAKRIGAVGQCEVIVTDGGNPVSVITLDNDVIEVTPPQVNVIDTTGAGDIFKAGLLYGLMQNMSKIQAIKWAVAAGSLTVTYEGTTVTLGSLSSIGDLVSRVE